MKFDQIKLLALPSMTHTTSGADIKKQTLRGDFKALDDYHKNCDKQDILLPDEINGKLVIQSF